MNMPSPRFAALVFGLIAAFVMSPALAGEPVASEVQDDPMYRVVFADANPVASIRTPVESADNVAGPVEEWPEIAAQWHPRSVPMTPAPSR